MSFGGGGGDEILRKQIELMVQSNPQVVQVLQNEINNLTTGLNNFSQTSAQSNTVTTDTIQHINQLAAQIGSLQRVLGLATGAAGTNTAAWVRFAYLTSQGVEDLQYSFAALANNIPLMAQSFAQAMGLNTTTAMAWAAGLSGVATAVNVLLVPAMRHMMDTSPELQGFLHSLNAQLNPLYVQKYGDEISALTARIKELEGKKVRLAVDTAELDRLRDELREAKKDKEAFDDAMTGRTKEEREAGKAVEEAIAEAPAGEPEITARIAAQFAQQGRAESPKLREKREQLAELKAYRATLDPNALVDRTKIEEADRQIAQAIDESLSIQTAISENAKRQAGHMLRMAKEGRAPDVENLLPFLRGLEKAPDIGVGPVAGDLSKQVEAAADRAREQVAIDRDMPALKKVADERKKAREETERIAEGARQKAVADKDKAEAETERIAEGARQKAVQDADKAERERQRKAEQRTREVAGAFDQSVETSLAAMFQQNRAQREVVARMRPAERRQFLRQRQLEQREIKRQRAAEARGENLARRMMAPAERAAFDRQRQLRDRQRALFEAPAVPLGEDAMQALMRRRLAGQLVGAHDARGMVIDQVAAGAAADAILNKLFEKINAAQLGAVAGVPPAGGRGGAIDQMFGGGMIDVMPPRMPPMGRGRGGFRSVAPAPPQAGGDFGMLGGQLATNQAGLVNGQVRIANTAQQAFAYAQAVGRQVEDMMRWHARMQPQRGHFWPGFYGGF
jgi:hypothetical protein